MEEKDCIEPIDILDRKEFIENILTIISSCKEQNRGTSFSVSGGWGYGKSFILDRLQENLSEDNVVLRYDSWKYDYYEEPLVALVSSIADQLLDDEGRVSNGITKASVKAATRMAVDCAIELAGPFAPILKAAKKAHESFQKDEQKALDYDCHSALKKNLIAIQKLITVLAEEKQVILMIDELDRCLPTYQIKVLERIHHVISDTQIIVIYALNPIQLSETIRQIYGGNDDRVTAYLKKFLHFSLSLDIGKVSDDIKKKYEQDISEFEPFDTEGPTETEEWFDKVCGQLLSELDIRTQEKLWETRKIIHNIIFSKETAQLPQIFLTSELLLLVMNEWKKRASSPREWGRVSFVDDNISLGALIGGGFRNKSGNDQIKTIPNGVRIFWEELHRRCSDRLTTSLLSEKTDSKTYIIDRLYPRDVMCLVAVWTYVNDAPLQIKKRPEMQPNTEVDVFSKLRETMKQFNMFVKIMS